MQVIENKAAIIITNTRHLDRKTNKFVNDQANLISVNISLNQQAHRIWQKVVQEVDREFLDKLDLEIGKEYSGRIPSSRILADRNVREIISHNK